MSMSSLSSLSDPEMDIQHRHIPDRINLFDKHDGEDFRIRYRFSKDAVVQILNLIGDLEPTTHRNKSIDGMTQLLICLRFFATGSFHQVIGDIANIHKSTICRIIQKVTHEIAKLSPNYINMPGRDELRTVAQGFYEIAGFPRVAGALDCTHVKIISRGGMLSELYRCRKGHFSINVQVVCDAQLKIRDIIARWPGSVHDCTIFNNSHLCANFEMGLYNNYHLLGDSGYYCKKYLLTPFLQPQTPAEEAYNKSHISTRNTVERCFGVWKRRSPCLQKGMTLTKTSTILKVIVATAVLHNMCIEIEEVDPPDDMEFEDEEAFLLLQDGTQNDSSARTAVVNTVFS